MNVERLSRSSEHIAAVFADGPCLEQDRALRIEDYLHQVQVTLGLGQCGNRARLRFVGIKTMLLEPQRGERALQADACSRDRCVADGFVEIIVFRSDAGPLDRRFKRSVSCG